jgi:hypothetical protein
MEPVPVYQLKIHWVGSPSEPVANHPQRAGSVTPDAEIDAGRRGVKGPKVESVGRGVV